MTSPTTPRPFGDEDLHALADRQLDPARERELEAWLVDHPDEARRVDEFRTQKRQLRELFDPVLAEPVPPRLQRAARAGPSSWRPAMQRIAAGFALLAAGLAGGWALRGAATATSVATTAGADLPRRAAVAHAVYVPEQRRPVEVDAAHEDQLVTWLSKRMGAPMRPPLLQPLGYALEGGRLLPGDDGPVAQFMYRDAQGRRLTLYVAREAARAAADNTAFRFTQEGAVNVFYWVDGPFGYALSAQADRATLARVSSEVYRQLTAAGGS